MTALANRITGSGEEAPEALLANPRNWRRHPARQAAALQSVLGEVGWVQQVIVNRTTGHLVDGHLRVSLAREAGEALVPVVYVELSPEEEALVLASLDPLGAMAEADSGALADLLAEVSVSSADLEEQLAGYLSEAEAGADHAPRLRADTPSLADRFLVPPFSVLDARQGYWQERKRQWLGLGIRSELGRGENLLEMSDTILGLNDKPGRHPAPGAMQGRNDLWAPAGKVGKHYDEPQGQALTLASLSGRVADYYDMKRAREELLGRELSREEFEADWLERPEGGLSGSGTSTFDPVLSELVYRWFSPPGGQVLDPFAGGSVRGIVAGALGRAYTGIDLSAAQLSANREQAEAMAGVLSPAPEWIEGDCRAVLAGDQLGELQADLVFSCPPYADLERYSDDPADISTMSYPDFSEAYAEAIRLAVERLRPDRFVCWVVSEVREPPPGRCRGLVPDTVAAFAAAGASLYNEAVYVTMLGSLPVRVGRQFAASRKLGRTHQTLLTFCKGDPMRATAACGDIDVADPVALVGGEAQE